MIIIDLFLGDCLEVAKEIPDNSVDLILTDLPYGTTACRWDIIIPFAPLWEQYKRIRKDTTPIVLTASQPFTSLLINSNFEEFRYEWIWEKPQGTNPLNAKIMPLKAHENIVVFYKKTPIYNPIMTKGKPYKGFYDENKTIGEIYDNQISQHKENLGTRYPKSVIKFSQSREGLHPTQKPLELMEYLIQTYTNPEAVVFDSCMGSGTTGVAAKKLNRSFIGIEKEEKYFEIAKKRIDNVMIL